MKALSRRYPLLAIVLIASSGLLLAGCATILNGSTQKITVNSSPNGASVIIEGEEVGETPVTTSVKRGGDGLSITLKKQGYQVERTTLNSKMSVAFLGNVVSGGPVGSTTDYVTKSMYKYAPSSYNVELTPKGESKEARRNRLKRREVRRYILTSYYSIANELDQGEGKHLEALLDRLKIKSTKRGKVIERLRNLRARTSISGFANTVVNRFEVAS